MKFEDILAEIGGFGRFQKLIVFLSFVSRLTLPCHFLLNNYIGAIPSHHCDISFLDAEGVFGNLTQEEKLTVSIPKNEDGIFASCHMFAEPQFQLLDTKSNFTNVPLIQCPNGWEYDNSTFISTLSTQWDLVCEKRGMTKAVATIFFVGVMFGAAIFGSLSDRYGRRVMLLVSYIAGMTFAVASIFSSSFTMFAVLRFFTGLGITGIVIITSVLSVEWVDIESRKMVLVIDSLSWSFGYMVLPIFAYGIRDWKWLTITVTSPLIIAIISWRWFPESSRWLIATGKAEKAHFYMKRCAVMNKRKAATSSLKPEVLSHIVSEKGHKNYSYLDLMRTPKMRRLAFLTGFTWYGVASTYYGISFNIKGFGLDLYLTQFLFGFVELPTKILVYYLLDRIGRHKTEVGALLLVGSCLLVNVFISKDQWIIRTVIGVLGKAFASMSFSTLVLYSSELYPTVIRQNGMGYNSFLGRMGVALAPMIILLDEVWGHLSQVILCAIALITALVAYQLPETRGTYLPETIEDIEGSRMDQFVTLMHVKGKEEEENEK
ncbi:solute carrier family 22 member 7-like [Pygocentrus nattereri]|uniref:Solute carrier family 22 member 6 n=1 Tax=Pygocentrus nattereri TaxID=42514 RepID=A0AAR2LYM0_PYGNA|nr:solute carrier family 22 member 7-like [Pygocentrus nattereri]